jgi:dihydrofolate reductase
MGDPVRRLVEATLVSLDGVVESPAQWAPFDQEAATTSLRQLETYGAFVLGRRTYEMFAEMWGPQSGEPYVDALNAMPKYVASRTLTATTWNATLLGDDVVADLRRLKSEPGKDLIKYGTSQLDQTLLDARLVDVLQLWVMPVVVGQGRRLFEGVDTSGLELSLTSTHTFGNGSVMLTYSPSWNDAKGGER